MLKCPFSSLFFWYFEKTGHPYYEHSKTQQVQWNRPDDFEDSDINRETMEYMRNPLATNNDAPIPSSSSSSSPSPKKPRSGISKVFNFWGSKKKKTRNIVSQQEQKEEEDDAWNTNQASNVIDVDNNATMHDLKDWSGSKQYAGHQYERCCCCCCSTLNIEKIENENVELCHYTSCNLSLE